MTKIILSADSTCDLGDELKAKYQVHYYPFHIILGDKQYQDNVDITPEEIFQAYWERKILPKTAAIGVGDYLDYFRKWVENGYQVIHLNLGSGISSAYQNCCMAARELGNVFPINSGNLSSAIGLLVVEAGKRISQGMPAPQIQKEIQELTAKCHGSFVLDTLEFLHAGGRCSAVAALGANLLRLKPCIEVNNRDATMRVGKKYRGDLDKVLVQYTRDKLMNRDDLNLDRCFLVNAGISKERLNLVKKTIEECADFEHIYITKASCTISCHCGPNTLGVMFLTK